MSEWKTMETAPKDGTELLVTDGRHNFAVVRWYQSSDVVDVAGWYISDWHNDPIWLRGNPYMTHWMPLPEAPQGADQT